MALTIVVEDGSGKANANSYASSADGDSYHDGHLYASAWTGSAVKEEALVMATRLLDDYMRFNGKKASSTQALEWPRYEVTDRSGFLVDADEIPQNLIDATAELARWLLSEDRTAEADDKGFKQLKVGSLSLTPDPGDRSGVLPSVVVGMLSQYGHSVTGGTARVTR